MKLSYMEKNDILHRYLNDNASPEEVELIKTSPDFAAYLTIADAVSGFETPPFDSEATFKNLASKLPNTTKVKTLNPLSIILKIAAIVAILFVGYLYISSMDTTVSTQIGQKETFLLPDNSEVALNAASKIVYNKKRWMQNRSLNLDGEAYFKVNNGSAFSVNTLQGVVTVLGTEFNVYSRDRSLRVSCYEGLVSVAFSDTIIKVPAGMMLAVENGNLNIFDENHSTNPEWMHDESHFENAPLTLVLNELQRQYPIKVTFENAKGNFTGSFTHSNLSIALKSICEPLHLDFAINGTDVNIYAKNN